MLLFKTLVPQQLTRSGFKRVSYLRQKQSSSYFCCRRPQKWATTRNERWNATY